MQLIIYNTIIQCYYLVIRLAAFFKPKAKLWVEGRDQYFERLEKAFESNKQPVMWMHCASLGEFEQGRPILEAFKQQLPEYRILLTFFSPSGYEIRKDYTQADDVFYLALDTKKNAARFLELTQPAVAIFIKYEFWYFFLNELKQNNINTILVSAIFRPKQIFFKWYGALHRQMLTCFQQIFVQDESSKQLITNRLGIQNVTFAGDTRVDRVLRIAAEDRHHPTIDAFAKGSSVFVCGSTWPADEAIICDFINGQKKDWKFIIAPHEIDEAHLKAIEQKIKVPCCRYSQMDERNTSRAIVLLIDNIGMLSSLYRYARLAYVGGGFGKSIHNILEPAAFSIPVLFGPRHQQFMEANILKSKRAAFVIQNKTDLTKFFELFSEEEYYNKACQASKQFMILSKGATEVIMKYLLEQTKK